MSTGAWPQVDPQASTTLVRNRYARGLSIAAIVIAGAWHVANDLLMLISNWSLYRWPSVAVAAWIVCAAVVAIAGRAVLGRAGQHAHPWPLAGVVLVAVGTVDVASGHQVLGPASWGWGLAGWLAVLLFWRRGLRALAGFLAANSAIPLVVLAASGDLGRSEMARYLMVAIGTSTLQLGFYGGALAMQAAAGWAVAASAAAADAVARTQIADEVHLMRQRRYASVQRTLVRVLADLVAGSDPADPGTRQRCATEAARLRRLVAETDDVPDPLLHELRACADVAERKGVVVDLVTVGEVPELPPPVRRALVEPIIGVLAAATTHARITVATTADRVVVAVVADADVDVAGVDVADADANPPDANPAGVPVDGPGAPAGRGPGPGVGAGGATGGADTAGRAAGVTVSSYRDEDDLWIETSAPVPAAA